MAPIGIDQVFSSAFVQKLVRASSSSSGSSSSNQSSNKPDGQALYTSLRSGARSFGAGVQLLNRGISVINVSPDLNEKLLSIVEGMERVVDRANKGNLSASSSKEYRTKFDALVKSFETLISESTKSDLNPLDASELENVLVEAGLDKNKISELATMLRKISSPDEAVLDSAGNVIVDGSPIPTDEIRRQLQAAIFDDSDPSDDRSGFFNRTRSKLRDVRLMLETNVKAVERTRDFVKVNLDLVRATGLALLDVSDSMTGRESVEQLAEQIRLAVRASAPAALSQAKHLDGVLVAGLAQVSQESE